MVILSTLMAKTPSDSVMLSGQHILTPSESIFVTLASASDAKGYPYASFFDAWGFQLETI